MDKIILWFSLGAFIALFVFSLRKSPMKEWILAFFVTAYFANFFGAIVAKLNLIKYPENFLSQYFSSSLLFELIAFPVINVYFYQTSYRSGWLGIIIQCVLYTSGITVLEVILKKYTNLIVYMNWNWLITFISVLLFMLGVRLLLELQKRVSKNERI
ncbi:CBO0543 family protein [Lentibacillus sp. N15]|uniref:CBO0543 family protein n=1 Tax=Lentibacillus songyuanensis TaxID=3136161 RepID=UPI0031B9F506